MVMYSSTCVGTFWLVNKIMTKDFASYAYAYTARAHYPRKRKLYLGGVAL